MPNTFHLQVLFTIRFSQCYKIDLKYRGKSICREYYPETI